MPVDILHYGRLPWPVDWPELFGRQAPLLLEIGFGGGHYLVDWAIRRPDCNLLGLEISFPSLRRAVRKLDAAGVKNARIIQGDSSKALWLLSRPAALSEVAINFPDPWPKASHEHRRLINVDFLHLLASRLKPGGWLDIATDHEQYAEQVAESLLQSPYFDSRLTSSYTLDAGNRIRTKYEQIALAEGRQCRYFLWRRNDQPAPNKFPIPEEKPVPHVVVSLPVSLEQIGREFEPFEVAVDGIHINYLEMYHSYQHAMQLVELYISEEPYHQRVCLALRRRREGDVVISLHELGFPRPTPAIHQAVHHLVQWLRSLHPDLAVLNSTLNPGAVENA